MLNRGLLKKVKKMANKKTINVAPSQFIEVEHVLNIVIMTVDDGEDVAVVEIKKEHALQIINHLKDQFNL